VLLDIFFTPFDSLRVVLRSVIGRRKPKGKSGKYLVTTGMSVLVAGMFTETLGIRIGAGPLELSVLEGGIIVLGIALIRLLLVVIGRKLRRGLLKGVGVVGLGVALPAVPFAAPIVSAVGGLVPSFAAVSFFGGAVTRLSKTVGGVLGFGETRLQRLKRALGGVKGISTGSVGVVLTGYGIETGSLNEVYTVFGTQLSLQTVFGLLSVPGAIIYVVRNW